MHELSVASAIVDTAIRHARGRPVSVVYLRVGALRQVVEESLSFYFDVVTRDTLCEQARLEIEPVAALMRCRSCGQEWDPAPRPALDEDELIVLPRFRCPACSAAGAEVLAGNELLVDSIDVQDDSGEAPPPVAAPGSRSTGG